MRRSFEEVMRSSLNNSKTKQAHAFPHSQRFATQKAICQNFYDLNAVMMSSQIKKKSKSVSQSARNFIVTTPGPGPLAYHIKSFVQQSKNKKIGPSFSLSKRQSFQLMLKAPGPGAYSPKLIKDKQGAFTIGAKIEYPSNKLLIGPGQYQTEKYNSIANPNNLYSKYSKSQSFKIGTQQRFHSPSFISPGPNQYATKGAKHNQTFSFAKEKRHSIIEGFHKTPGPGAYNQFSEFAQRRRRLESNLRKMQKIVKQK